MTTTAMWYVTGFNEHDKLVNTHMQMPTKAICAYQIQKHCVKWVNILFSLQLCLTVLIEIVSSTLKVLEITALCFILLSTSHANSGNSKRTKTKL